MVLERDALLAEYVYVTGSQRDELNRLNLLWITLIPLVGATSAFLASDSGSGNTALIAPFGMLAWGALQLVWGTVAAFRGEYIRALERRMNSAAGASPLQYETEISHLYSARSTVLGWTPFTLTNTISHVLYVGLYVGFGFGAANNIDPDLRPVLVVSMAIGAVLYLGAVLHHRSTFRRWKQYINPSRG